MDLLLVADGHYYIDKASNVYVESVYDYSFYRRYLSVFDHVYAVARIQHINETSPNRKVASGEGVTFLELPEYRGPWQYLKMYSRINTLARQYSHNYQCAIFRLPGATANIMCKCFSRTGKPFAVELVVDPWENFKPKVIRSMTRPLVRLIWTDFVRRMCKRANGVSYVTKEYLQKHYPSDCMRQKPRGGTFTASYSSVELPDDSFGAPRIHVPKPEYTIAHVANSFNDDCKGHIPLMHALKKVRDNGIPVNVIFVGDGPLKSSFEQLARVLGIEDHVHFVGRLASGTEVRQVIRNADIFVFPTRAEGLPRVLLEAMAEGLPCISSPTCGVPEILDSPWLCDYDDWNALAERIACMLSHPVFMNHESAKNINTAKQYSASILNARRKAFYERLRMLVEERNKSKK